MILSLSEGGRGGRGERETERDRDRDRQRETETDSWRKKQREKEKKKRRKKKVDPTLEKEEGFQFQTSHGINRKVGVAGEKKTLVRCNENLMIFILIKVSLPSKLIF